MRLGERKKTFREEHKQEKINTDKSIRLNIQTTIHFKLKFTTAERCFEVSEQLFFNKKACNITSCTCCTLRTLCTTFWI